jgi:hypothetical protein
MTRMLQQNEWSIVKRQGDICPTINRNSKHSGEQRTNSIIVCAASFACEMLTLVVPALA